jgi:putative ABC transport system substrate-binding protein
MQWWKFTALVMGGLATWAFVWPVSAQTVPIIGFLNSASRDPFAQQLAAFHQGLGEAGYAEDRNVAIEYRWADGRYDRLPALAADLVRRKIAMIVATGGTTSALAAAGETATIPILVVSGSDPDQLAMEARARPGPRTVTGATVYHTQLAVKRLDLLRELVPKPAKLAFLVNPNAVLTPIETRDVETAARDAGLQVLVLRASAENEFAPVISEAVQAGADTLLVSADSFFTSQRAQIVALAAQYALRAVYPWREYVEIGGLMSYGPRLSEVYRDVGRYAGRILNGVAPASLPIQVPRKFELTVNLQTARALGLAIPPLLLARIDEAIE